MSRTIAWGWVVVCAGCSSGKDDAGSEPVEHYGCVHIVEGAILDASADREDAPEIRVGADPYRVNVKQGVASYVRFESGAADLVLLQDYAGAGKAVWTGEDRVEIEPGEPDPNCEEDIPEVGYFSVSAGTHQLELGPIYNANVWILLSEQ